MTPVKNELYPRVSHSLGVFIDTTDPRQEQHLCTLRKSFGDQYAIVEELQGPLYRYLDLRTGGLREVAR